jgi:hypothetical protein
MANRPEIRTKQTNPHTKTGKCKIMKYLLIISALLIASCTYKPKATVATNSNMTYKYLFERHSSWLKSLKYIEGSARIMLDSPSYSQNFDATLAVRGKDSLSIAVSGPFGMNVGRFFVAKSRFIFYNEIMNQFYTGNIEDFKGRNFMQFPVEVNQLRSVFVAGDEFKILKKETYTIQKDAYFVKASNGAIYYNIWFDPKTLLIKKLEHYNNSELLYSKEYSQFKEMNGVWFPMLINFVRLSQKEALTIYFNEMKINQTPNPSLFDIKISDNAKQINLSLEEQ